MARKDLGAKNYLYPQPVLILAAYDENNHPNCMNAAWGGISDYNQISIDLSNYHKTVKNILMTGAFTVSPGVKSQVVACDYVGMVSGNDEKDKITKAGWSTSKASHVNAPIINELPLALECRLISYDEETGIMKGEIVNVSVDEKILDDKGHIDMDKFGVISFDPDNNKYILLKEMVGNTFKDGLQLKK